MVLNCLKRQLHNFCGSNRRPDSPNRTRVISFICLTLCSFFVPNYGNIDKFFRPTYCPNSVLHLYEAYEIRHTRSLVECSIRCSESTNCFSLTYSKPTKTCQLNQGVMSEICRNVETLSGGVYLEKTQTAPVCLHGGQYTHGGCFCVNGFLGRRCERIMTDCSEGYREIYTDPDLNLYTVFPSGAQKPFTVACSMVSPGRTILMRHFQPDFKFNRTWDEYENGFKFDSFEYWLGLENIYLLTRSSVVKFYMEFVKSAGQSYTMKSSDFKIGNSSAKYMLTNWIYDTTASGLADCMTELLNFPFVTFDKDNVQRCSASHGAGWWFGPSCAICNPAGDLNNPTGGSKDNVPNTASAGSEAWSPWGVTIWIEN